MQVLKIKLCLMLLVRVELFPSATLNPDALHITPPLNLSRAATATNAINGSSYKILEVNASTLFKSGGGNTEHSEDKLLTKVEEYFHNLTDSDEDLFSSIATSDSLNLTTESWDFDSFDLQNTSIEEIFKPIEKRVNILNETNDISNRIIEKWILEKTQNHDPNDSLETQIKDVKVNGLFMVENSTTLIGVDEHSRFDTVTTETYETTTITGSTVLSDMGGLNTETITLLSEIWTQNTALQAIVDYSTSQPTPSTTDTIISSTNQNQVDSINEEDMTEDIPMTPNVIGTLRNKNEIICVSLNCSIQIYINNTPIAMPSNLSILESFDSEHGYMTFNWFNSNNDSTSVRFIIHSKGEYYYIDSCKLIINNEDIAGKDILLEKKNLQLFRTKIGTTLKTDNGVLLPMGQGIVLHIDKTRFTVLGKLFTTEKLLSSSDNSLSEYFLEILCGAVGLVLFSILTMFICRRYIPSIVNKKP